METRIKCDASRAGLGAALEQLSPTGWHTVAFASRYLNSNKKRHSLTELELLWVVWSVEHFKHYLFVKSFTIITDYRALLSILKERRSNKSYTSRLTRWVDHLLTFDFNIEHIPGAKMGLVDYISRQPNQEAKVTNIYDEEFAVATITRFRDAIAAICVNTTRQNCQSQHFSSVNYTHSTRVSHPHSKNYSNLLSAINLNTTQLLLENSANAAQINLHSNLNTLKSNQFLLRTKFKRHTHPFTFTRKYEQPEIKPTNISHPQQDHIPFHAKLGSKFNTLIKRRSKFPQPGIVEGRSVRKKPHSVIYERILGRAHQQGRAPQKGARLHLAK